MRNFGQGFMCLFDPGIILRFAANKHTLDLVLCFHCHEMILFSDGKAVRRPYKYGSIKNSFFREASRSFKAISKKAFPGDTEIQALK
jgi:hypothetical protein